MNTLSESDISNIKERRKKVVFVIPEQYQSVVKQFLEDIDLLVSHIETTKPVEPCKPEAA